MVTNRSMRLGVIAGCFSAAVLLVTVATSASSPSFSTASRAATSSDRVQVEQFSSRVDRSLKGDRPSYVKTGGASFYIGIEATATSNVIVRDKDGNILFAVDHSSRTTTVGKSKGRAAGPTPAVEQELPDGCEGAFSPYVNPSKARVIGRCVSGLSSSRNRVG